MDSRSVVLLSGPEFGCYDEVPLRFRLTYEGELRPTQRDPRDGQHDRLGAHKQDIRKAFHVQLRELWRTNKFLRDIKVDPKRHFGPNVPPVATIDAFASPGRMPLAEALADRYQQFGFKFVPLVREELSLLCSLRILFLRRDAPGSALYAGDIDNRLKTVIDALRRPRSPNELQDVPPPSADETPFYCLLEDDSQVTHFEVETDTLLNPMTDSDADHRKSHLIITVDLKPYDINMFNLSFS